MHRFPAEYAEIVARHNAYRAYARDDLFEMRRRDLRDAVSRAAWAKASTRRDGGCSSMPASPACSGGCRATSRSGWMRFASTGFGPRRSVY